VSFIPASALPMVVNFKTVKSEDDTVNLRHRPKPEASQVNTGMRLYYQVNFLRKK